MGDVPGSDVKARLLVEPPSSSRLGSAASFTWLLGVEVLHAKRGSSDFVFSADGQAFIAELVLKEVASRGIGVSTWEVSVESEESAGAFLQSSSSGSLDRATTTTAH